MVPIIWWWCVYVLTVLMVHRFFFYGEATDGGRKLDWRWWQWHSRTLSLYPSQSFCVIKTQNKNKSNLNLTNRKTQLKVKFHTQIKKNVPVLMGHRVFFLCACASSGLILPFSQFLSPCLSQASSPLSISLLAPYKLCFSLWLYLS